MALSFYTDHEAPRDFRISSTESDGHYTKCVLCYTVKRNFYCVDCVKAGNFIHSSMPYTDRFAEKQAKLLRLKINKKHVLDRCEKLLAGKVKKDLMLIEAKQSRDKIDLLRLAIEQRRSIIDKKKKELEILKQHNIELNLKLPRYQKRVASLEKYAETQRMEFEARVNKYNDFALTLAALRRSRIRQLTTYIFPVYTSYDASDSIEDLEFVCAEDEAPPPAPAARARLHVGAPWLDLASDFTLAWGQLSSEASPEGAAAGAGRAGAALALAAQLAVLLAWLLDVRLPYAMSLNSFITPRSAHMSAARLCACASVLARGLLRGARGAAHAGPALLALAELAERARADAPPLGRVERWLPESVLEGAVWDAAPPGGGAGGGAGGCDNEPEHLSWPEGGELEELSSSPGSYGSPGGAGGAGGAGGMATSLVTSAAASLASMWKGWGKN